MTVTMGSPEQQLADAVRICREQRHHADCRCGLYRNQAGGAFCNAFESSWTRIVDDLIDRVTQQPKGNV